ncbi:MAG: ABC transporter permease subunit, partial [Spirochaetales bacterium]|nr:ABC transporter permease subunit [Spirochaetales bacterium]
MSEKRQVSIKNLTLSVRYFLLGLAVLSLFFCALFFILPYCRAILPSLQNPSSITINRKSLFKIVWFTLSESLLSSLVALVVGFIAAYYVSHKRFFFRKFLLSLSSIPVCLPPLVVALGYISSFGISGYYNDFLKYIFGLKESPMTFLYSFWGLVMVQGFYNFPLVMTNVADSWSTIDRNQSESALLLGASRIRIFFDITLRQLLPAIVSGCIPVFIYTFFSFMLVLLFGTT